MAEEFHDFGFVLSHDTHGYVPAWKREGLYHRGKISRAALELLHYPRVVDADMTEAYKDHATAIAGRAQERLEATDGVYDSPLILDVDDF